MIPERLENKRHRAFEIDFQRHPAVVFESDDWGCCETVKDAADAARCVELARRHGFPPRSWDVTLETPADLRRLFDLLLEFNGADGLPPVFTAFTGMSNPDYAAIRANKFTRYVDMALDKGVPAGWARGDIVAMMREGVASGVWAPAFHSFLHHTSPKTWMALLNADSPDGRFARDLFDMNCYCQGRHLPEYDGLNVAEQLAFIQEGAVRFKRSFGFPPRAAVTSDAYLETEILWAACGMTAICLKNCRINSGEVVVYPTKPWNMQDVYAKIGDFNPMLNAIYLTRNVFFESGDMPADVLPIIDVCREKHNEPAVISIHRGGLVSVSCGVAEAGCRKLRALLAALTERKVCFLSSVELADIYRQGWSLRRIGAQAILRKWHPDAVGIRLDDGCHGILSLPDRRSAGLPAGVAELPCGNYLLE